MITDLQNFTIELRKHTDYSDFYRASACVNGVRITVERGFYGYTISRIRESLKEKLLARINAIFPNA